MSTDFEDKLRADLASLAEAAPGTAAVRERVRAAQDRSSPFSRRHRLAPLVAALAALVVIGAAVGTVHAIRSGVPVVTPRPTSTTSGNRPSSDSCAQKAIDAVGTAQTATLGPLLVRVPTGWYSVDVCFSPLGMVQPDGYLLTQRPVAQCYADPSGNGGGCGPPVDPLGDSQTLVVASEKAFGLAFGPDTTVAGLPAKIDAPVPATGPFAGHQLMLVQVQTPWNSALRLEIYLPSSESSAYASAYSAVMQMLETATPASGTATAPDAETQAQVRRFEQRIRRTYGARVSVTTDWAVSTILVASATPIPVELQQYNVTKVAGLRVVVFPAVVTTTDYQAFVRKLGAADFPGKPLVAATGMSIDSSLIQVYVTGLSGMSVDETSALREHLESLTSAPISLREAPVLVPGLATIPPATTSPAG